MRNGFITALVAAVASIVCAGIAGWSAIVAAEPSKEVKSEAARALRFVYEGSSPVTTDYGGGKMVVIVNGSERGGPAVKQVDMDRFKDMCSDVDGCTLSLGATRFRETENGRAIPSKIISAPLMGSPCKFYYDNPTKSLSLSQSCVVRTSMYKYVGQWPLGNWQFDNIYSAYTYGNYYGNDDDGNSLIVIGFGGACYLSEAAPDTYRGEGNHVADSMRDKSSGEGLYLIASSPLWEYPNVYPKDVEGADTIWPSDDPERKCILFVEN